MNDVTIIAEALFNMGLFLVPIALTLWVCREYNI